MLSKAKRYNFVIMRRIVFSLFLFFVCNPTFSQSYMWSVVDKNSKKSDTVFTSVDYYLPNVYDSIDFKEIIAQIKKTRLDVEMIQMLHSRRDSLLTLKKDSTIQEELNRIEYELNNPFQIIKNNDFEVAFYGSDTINVSEKPIVIYLLSSNFKTKWNEDYFNWFVFYTKEYGVIKARYECIFDFPEDQPCFTKIYQTDSNQNRNAALIQLIKESNGMIIWVE